MATRNPPDGSDDLRWWCQSAALLLACCSAPKFADEDPAGVYRLESQTFTLCNNVFRDGNGDAVGFRVEDSEGGKGVLFSKAVDVARRGGTLTFTIGAARDFYLPVLNVGESTGFLFVDPSTQSPLVAQRVGDCPTASGR